MIVGWERAALVWLRWLEAVTAPAFAGAACALLVLPVVTWLPALAATARTLHRWRTEGETSCFTGVFADFRRYWRPLLPHSLLGAVAAVLLTVNAVLLTGPLPQASAPVAFGLLVGQLGLGAVLVLYHLGVAVAAALAPEAGAGDWRRGGLVVAFGSPRRGLALLATVAATPVVTLVLPLGPVLYGVSLPLLVGLGMTKRLPGGPGVRSAR